MFRKHALQVTMVKQGATPAQDRLYTPEEMSDIILENVQNTAVTIGVVAIAYKAFDTLCKLALIKAGS